MVTETRYGKWLERAASGAAGGERGRRRAHRRQAARARAADAAGVRPGHAGQLAHRGAGGRLAAWRQGKAFDVASSVVLFVLYATPTFAIAELLRRATLGSSGERAEGGAGRRSRSWPARSPRSRAGSAARCSTSSARTSCAPRAPRACPRGASPWCTPCATRWCPPSPSRGCTCPSCWAARSSWKRSSGCHGMGFETLRAIEAHDAAWLMAVVLASAAFVTIGLVASDVAYGALDPRVRELSSPGARASRGACARERRPLLAGAERRDRSVAAQGRRGAVLRESLYEAGHSAQRVAAPYVTMTRVALASLARDRLARAGSLVLACLAMVAIFADLLASDLPLACRWHGSLYVLPAVTQPGEPVGRRRRGDAAATSRRATALRRAAGGARADRARRGDRAAAAAAVEGSPAGDRRHRARRVRARGVRGAHGAGARPCGVAGARADRRGAGGAGGVRRGHGRRPRRRARSRR